MNSDSSVRPLVRTYSHFHNKIPSIFAKTFSTQFTFIWGKLTNFPTHPFISHPPILCKEKTNFQYYFFQCACVREGECVCDMLYVHVFHFYDKYHLLTSWTAPFHEGPNHCIIHDTFDAVYSIFTCLIPRDSIQHKYLPYHRKRYWKGQTCKINRNFVWLILTKYWTNITKSTVLSETIG